MEKNYKAENAGHYGAKMTVMQPTVKNVSSKSVAWKEIPLSRGLFTKVDISDYDSLNQHKWFARKSRDTYYAYRNGKSINGKWGDVICTDTLNPESMDMINKKGYFEQSDPVYQLWLEEKLMELLK